MRKHSCMSGNRRGWKEIEGAFRHFGGLPGELLLDNASALVKHHDPVTREVEFNDACTPLPGIGACGQWRAHRIAPRAHHG